VLSSPLDRKGEGYFVRREKRAVEGKKKEDSFSEKTTDPLDLGGNGNNEERENDGTSNS